MSLITKRLTENNCFFVMTKWLEQLPDSKTCIPWTVLYNFPSFLMGPIKDLAFATKEISNVGAPGRLLLLLLASVLTLLFRACAKKIKRIHFCLFYNLTSAVPLLGKPQREEREQKQLFMDFLRRMRRCKMY